MTKKRNTSSVSLLSSSFYKLAKNSANVFFWETDKNLTITFLSPSFIEHSNLSEKKLIGMNISDVLQSNEANAWKDFAENKKSLENKMFSMVAFSGQITHHLVNGTAINENNKTLGFCGICTIEEDKLISKKVIKRLQTTNKTILSSLTEALIIVDENNRLVVVSPKFNRMWGLEKDEIFIFKNSDILEKMKSLLVSKKVNLDFRQHLSNYNQTKDILKFKDGRIIERRSSPFILEDKIVGRCWYFKDVTQQINLVDQLGKLAFRDSLTRLYNRRWCEKKLKQLLRSNKGSLAFLYLDLDHFKVINDSCGHIYGDEVLEQISSLLLKAVGKKSFLSRLGGDEFGLILTNKNMDAVSKIAVKIKSAITDYTFLWKKKMFKIGVSIGVVMVEKGDDVRSVFVHADEACYISKETGRNKCTLYDESKPEFQKSQNELKWYDVIQKALSKGDFELWCQSINSIDQKGQAHFEILLRMRNEKNKLVSPSLFMGSADRFGMIFTIDKLVIKTFCQFYQDNYEVISDTLFSINVSGHSLSREGFLPHVMLCLTKHEVNCDNVCFEITESEIIKNLDNALDFIHQVKALGCKISLDDFGKGLTSFSYLKNIPYDFIKIDGQFVAEINDDEINEAIIKSIVYIAEVTDKKTIAEHIENEEILELVADLGVDYFQGNYFSKPHQIAKLLE